MAMIKASDLATVGPRWSSVICASPAGLHRMAFQEWGAPNNSRVVVCVHGLTRVSADFDALARRLAPNFRVVCPDVVGRGRSSWLKNPMLYGVSQYTADMVTLIARLNVERVDWVGTSMGGLIGMSLASLEDSPVSRLVLNDVGAVLSGDALSRIAGYVGVATQFESRAKAHQSLRTIFSAFGPHSEEEWTKIIDDVLVSTGEDGKVRVHYDPAIAEPFRAAYGAQALAGKKAEDLSLWSIFDAVRCPTLLLRGQESDLLSAEVFAEMKARGPKPLGIEFAGVGHAPTLMHDDQISPVISFLNEGR